MKLSKSVNSLSATSQQQRQQTMNGNSSKRVQPEPAANGQQQQAAPSNNSAPTSPICRCRVMYLGSSVPHETKDGLQGIQQPLRELYPDRATLSQGNAGIDSWLSVWSNGILIENVDETGREVKKFFKIEALHYCAAVKFVPQASQLVGPNITADGTATLPHSLGSVSPKFLPLDSPHARLQRDNNTSPPIFASILRRTTGVKVLECHAFICKREAAANALVRCCFHAYADTMYAKQIGAEIDNLPPPVADCQVANQSGTSYSGRPANGAPAIAARRSKSIAALNDVADNAAGSSGGEFSDSNHQQQRQDFQGAVLRWRSLNNGQQQLNYANSGDDMSDGGQQQQRQRQQQQMGYDSASSLQSQKYNSKSMHHLNQTHLDRTFNDFLHQNGGRLNQTGGQSTSYHNLVRNKFDSSCEPSPLFPHNPYAARVPSYPPQNIIDQQQQQQQQMQLQAANGGTLRSVKSMAANSIASTLLRSKKHAKAMSMAQLNSQQQQQQLQQLFNQPPISSFHQHPHQAPDGSLYGGSFMTLPPVPPMFLPSVPRHMNGSQTMKLPSRNHLLPQMGPPLPLPLPLNFETMTPKEMKKLLKKSAKYGLDPGRFADNGLPLVPLQPMPMQPQMHRAATFGPSAGGTINSMPGPDMPDLANPFGPPPPMFLGPPPSMPEPFIDPTQGAPIKSILVKPNPEFLKSKAGKKWLKQQKEFKKLLPSHLDGLPIVFGPPPMDMLDPADGHTAGPNSSASSSVSSKASQRRPMFALPPSHLPPPPPPAASAGQLPTLDSHGFYSPHPLYGPSGRASAASTLLRNSPQVMQQQLHEDHHHHQLMLQQQMNQHHQSMYSNPILMNGGQQQHHPPPPPPPPPPMLPSHLQQRSEDLYGPRPSYDPRQFGPSSASSSSRRRRNHMVEQSVISLGDEENEDDEPVHQNDGHSSSNTNDYYNQVDGQTQAATRHWHRREARKSSSGEHQQQTHENIADLNYQDDYEQIINQQQQHQMASEDRNSNSSGIYRRRGHINERAFSYSIRQEASKSSADNSDAEYRNGELSDSIYQSNNNNNNLNTINNNNTNSHPKYHASQQHHTEQQQQHDMAEYDNLQGTSYEDRRPIQYYKQHQQQHQPVNDLSDHLENQLNMKSFANSGVKSHM